LKVYEVKGELSSPAFARAFAQGCGGEVSDQYDGGDWCGFGSPQNWFDLQNAIHSGKRWIYADHGYFGRKKFYRVTDRAYQHTGAGHSDCRRFDSFEWRIKPWRCGSHVLVCPQTEGFFRLHGMDRQVWLDGVIAEIKKNTDREIRIREKNSHRPFAADLRGAHCVVGYTSNAAVEAILNGVPAICTGRCAASIMATSDFSRIENLRQPDGRREWAGVLADNQWTLDEIKNGMAWEALNVKV
jgi:hypothetical protein